MNEPQKQPEKKLPPTSQVRAGEVPPTALYYGPDPNDCIDFEVFGTPSNFRPIAKQIMEKTKPKPPQ